MQVYIGDVKTSINLNGVSYDVNVLNIAPKPDVLSALFTEESIKRRETATLVITTTLIVESIGIVNKAGREQSFTLVGVDIIDKVKQWTVQFSITAAGTQSFTVSGYGVDGNSGVTATASIKVTP